MFSSKVPSRPLALGMNERLVDLTIAALGTSLPAC